MTLARLLGALLGPVASRDSLPFRLAGALFAAITIGVAALLLDYEWEFVPTVALGYLVLLPLVAFAPDRRFLAAQTLAAVSVYVLARVGDTPDVSWQSLALLVQEVVLFVILWRAPIERIGVRRVLIAATTLIVIPLYYWFNIHLEVDINPFLGGWRQFVLLVVLMASMQRGAARTLRNMALGFAFSAPVPLERADKADRRFVTAIEGGLLFAAGLAVSALIKQHPATFGFVRPDWSVALPFLIGGWILFMLGVTVKVAAFGLLLMGHCCLLGVRVPAPINSPLRFTNLAEAWRGTGFYMYRFVYDGYYRTFFRDAGSPAVIVASVTAVFLVVGYQHVPWGDGFLTATGWAIWAIQGFATGLTIVYLRYRAKQRLRAYVEHRVRPARSVWSLLAVPVLVAAVLAFRGATERGFMDPKFFHHLAAAFGITR